MLSRTRYDRMKRAVAWQAAAAALLLASLPFDGAEAQFGFPVNLPQNDFRWVWGRNEVVAARGGDLDVRGGEGGFRCELSARLSPASRLSRMDMRNLERELQTTLFFIQSAANTMNALDQRHEIDWAVLECSKSQPAERDAEESQERVDKALERAKRKRDRRRALDAADDESGE
jgi:hypothetical protein